jgi:hypothetical protein
VAEKSASQTLLDPLRRFEALCRVAEGGACGEVRVAPGAGRAWCGVSSVNPLKSIEYRCPQCVAEAVADPFLRLRKPAKI